MSNPCLVVDVTDASEWAACSWAPSARLLPGDRKPTVLQLNRELAEAEAKRLAAMHAGHRFAIFEACLLSTTVTVPTHITLGGRVFTERQMAVLVEIDQSEIPF